MLLNPFTPSEIASAPDDFFGRGDELQTLERSLRQGSVAIQGPMGIGKSSLLARGRLMMDGFASDHRARSVVAVADKHVQSIDDAARLLLECFVAFDEQQRRLKVKVGSLVEMESGDVIRYFAERRHLAALKRILEEEYLRLILSEEEMLVLGVDEADKAPVPLTQAIRSVVTHVQQQGIKNVRFILAGVNPFFQVMVNEDPGIVRFFYKTISLEPMVESDAADLIETKLSRVVEHAEDLGLRISLDSRVVTRIVALSGGHPHLLQLLGSHLIEHEEEDPDGVLDSRDLANALRRICYEDRARVYTATLQTLELHNRLGDVRTLLGHARRGFPTRVRRHTAIQTIGEDAIQWLLDHNIVTVRPDEHYGMVDEFLRIRLVLDGAESRGDESRLERQMIKAADPEYMRNKTLDIEDQLIDRIDHPDDDGDD